MISPQAARPAKQPSAARATVFRQMEVILKDLHSALAQRDLPAVERNTGLAAELLAALRREIKNSSQLANNYDIISLQIAARNAAGMLKKSRQTVQALLAIYRSIPAPLPEGFEERP